MKALESEYYHPGHPFRYFISHIICYIIINYRTADNIWILS